MRNLQLPGRSPVLAPNGMVSTSQPLSTAAGLHVLREEAMLWMPHWLQLPCNAWSSPHPQALAVTVSVYMHQQELMRSSRLMVQGRAPLEISADWLLEQGVDKIQQQSAHAVTVPTAVDAWIQLNSDHGNMPLDQLLEPAIGYAKDGFPVGQRSAFDFAGCLELLQGDKDAADVFLKDGQTYQMGEVLRQPNLAKTLTAIAEQGRMAFMRAGLPKICWQN